MENQLVGTKNLRTDLVIKKDKSIIIIDVTVPFDNGLAVFDDARRLRNGSMRIWQKS